MILIDANILIYATIPSYPQYERSSEWLDQQLNGTVSVGLPWPSLLAFVRVVTNPRALKRPMQITLAWDYVQNWLDCPPVWIPMPTDRHAQTLEELLKQSGAHSDLVSDAHLAAIAIEHGLTLCSADGDFARFSGLRWRNPLLS